MMQPASALIQSPNLLPGSDVMNLIRLRSRRDKQKEIPVRGPMSSTHVVPGIGIVPAGQKLVRVLPIRRYLPKAFIAAESNLASIRGPRQTAHGEHLSWR